MIYLVCTTKINIYSSTRYKTKINSVHLQLWLTMQNNENIQIVYVQSLFQSILILPLCQFVHKTGKQVLMNRNQQITNVDAIVRYSVFLYQRVRSKHGGKTKKTMFST